VTSSYVSIIRLTWWETNKNSTKPEKKGTHAQFELGFEQKEAQICLFSDDRESLQRLRQQHLCKEPKGQFHTDTSHHAWKQIFTQCLIQLLKTSLPCYLRERRSS
jgi:hypothetical protein